MGAVNSPRRKPFRYIFCILLGPQSCLGENHSKAKPLPICSRTHHRHRAQACVVTSVLLRLGDPGLPPSPRPRGLPRRRCSASASPRGVCTHCRCRRSGPGSGCAAPPACTWWTTGLFGVKRTPGACPSRG